VSREFEELVGDLEYPMFIVTARAGQEPLGCLVGFATQMSIEPPRFLVGLSHTNRTFRHGHDAELFGVHCVPEHATDLAELFGGETGDDEDKFDKARWHAGPERLPLLDDCPSWFAGRILDRVPLGDHVGHVIEPFAGEDAGSGGWLPFQRAKQLEPGHEA
jgi:flavin reductase (DIM6/NTAB) family NADH-FMN oxidoreductase RutF